MSLNFFIQELKIYRCIRTCSKILWKFEVPFVRLWQIYVRLGKSCQLRMRRQEVGPYTRPVWHGIFILRISLTCLRWVKRFSEVQSEHSWHTFTGSKAPIVWATILCFWCFVFFFFYIYMRKICCSDAEIMQVRSGITVLNVEP